MKLDHLGKLSCPFGLLKQDSLSGVAALVSEVLTRTRIDGAEKDKLSYWQLIFLQSKANGCSYRDEALPHAKWQLTRKQPYSDLGANYFDERDRQAVERLSQQIEERLRPFGRGILGFRNS